MLSFRDRFFTRKVSTAMTSPLAIVAAGGGAAAGILAGGAAGPVGAVVGGIIGAIVAWSARVGLAVPKAPKKDRIDPFTIAEPWRRLTQDAMAAKRQFNDAVGRTSPGPIRDRLATIGERIDDSVEEAWAAARAGHELTDAYSRLDVASTQRELEAINATAAAPRSAATQATVTALEAQLATARRMYQMITDTREGLQLLNARLDESVAHSIELSVGAYRPEAFNEVEGDLGSITDELEALRGALEETSSPRFPPLPEPEPSAIAEAVEGQTGEGAAGEARPQAQ